MPLCLPDSAPLPGAKPIAEAPPPQPDWLPLARARIAALSNAELVIPAELREAWLPAPLLHPPSASPPPSFLSGQSSVHMRDVCLLGLMPPVPSSRYGPAMRSVWRKLQLISRGASFA